MDRRRPDGADGCLPAQPCGEPDPRPPAGFACPGGSRTRGRHFGGLLTGGLLIGGLLMGGLLMGGLLMGGCGGGNPKSGVSEQDSRDVQELLARKGARGEAASRVPLTLPPGTRFTREDLPTEGGYLQLPLVEITDAQADRLLRRLKTEFCTCGCPHTIDDCLIQDPACTTAQTLAHQVLKEVITGS